MPDPVPTARELSRAKKLREEASRLGIDATLGSEEKVRKAVAKAWIDENCRAIESSNDWVEKNGLPLARYRQF